MACSRNLFNLVVIACGKYSHHFKSPDHAFAESLISSSRDECLNMNWFLSLEYARDKHEAWRMDYNEYRPHSSLDYKTSSDFARSGLFEAGKLNL